MGSGFQISVPEVERIVTALDGLHSTFVSGTSDLAGLAVPTAQFGQIGLGAGQATTTAHAQLAVALQAFARVLQALDQRIAASARDYDTADESTATTLDQLRSTAPFGPTGQFGR
ncbi:hypothetical protein [Actinoplanes sp. NPDC051851]|uniref:hypothetical protein n=1 Tax=Actinoplanes sp. NPDC051851 TaxID=3154753 RepID=UPI003425D6E7